MHVFSRRSDVGAGAGQVYTWGNRPEDCLQYIVGNGMWFTPRYHKERVRQDEQPGGHKESAAE